MGVIEYVRGLEEVLIRSCADFGIPTRRIPGLTGVWTDPDDLSSRAHPTDVSSRAAQDDSLANHPVKSRDLLFASNEDKSEEAKIAALGVHISRAVTSHGFALNVNTDLSFFDLIIPCGIISKPVTSIERELGRKVDLNSVAESLSRNMGRVFSSQMLWVESLDDLLGFKVGVPMQVPEELRGVRNKEDDTTWA